MQTCFEFLNASEQRLTKGVRAAGVQLLEDRHEETEGVVLRRPRSRVACSAVLGDGAVGPPLRLGELNRPECRDPWHESTDDLLPIPDHDFAQPVLATELLDETLAAIDRFQRPLDILERLEQPLQDAAFRIAFLFGCQGRPTTDRLRSCVQSGERLRMKVEVLERWEEHGI